jgi:hypothetical protein
MSDGFDTTRGVHLYYRIGGIGEEGAGIGHFMEKRIKCIMILMLCLSLVYILFDYFLIRVEKYTEANNYHIWVYNLTNDNIDIVINDKKIANVEYKTLTMDKIFDNKRSYIYNYRIEINQCIILEKTIYFSSKECSSYSARGGLFTSIIIKEANNKNYDIVFTTLDSELNINEKLRLIQRKRITDIFDRDGLN